jgi:hypothetical protein
VATYYDINGQKVQNLASDPSPVQEGQVWYNTTSNTAKVEGYQADSVATSGNVNTARTQLGGVGTLNAGVIFGGESPALTAATENYDGSTWTSSGSAPVAKSDMHSSGTQTAALWGGGSPLSSGSFEYDGSTWTAGGNMTFSGRDFYSGSAGTQGAALQIGGFINPGSFSAVMQNYDGTSWANIPQTFPSAPISSNIATTGTQTSCISSGGPPGTPDQTLSQTWDGSSWTVVNSLSTGIRSAVASGTVGAGTLISGSAPSNPPYYDPGIQIWDGTCWALSPATLSVGRSQAAGGGGTGAAYVASGSDDAGYTNTTEIFTPAGLVTQTLTTS